MSSHRQVSGPKVVPCPQCRARLNTHPASSGTARFARTAPVNPAVCAAPPRSQIMMRSTECARLPRATHAYPVCVARRNSDRDTKWLPCLAGGTAVRLCGRSVQCGVKDGGSSNVLMGLRARCYFRARNWTVRGCYLNASVCRRFLCFCFFVAVVYRPGTWLTHVRGHR